MPDLHRINAILDGTLGSEAEEGPPLTEDELHRSTVRAIIRTYARDNPPPPLDRLTPEERARFLSKRSTGEET